MSNIIFVIGVNGVGKSTLIPFLKEKLDNKEFTIHDFDERGVPNNADKMWRNSETEYWIKLGKENISLNISTIICGFIKPHELNQIAITKKAHPRVILLHADSVNIKERIMGRYKDIESVSELFRTTGKTPETFVQDNIWISNQLKNDCVGLGYSVIDTSNKNSENIANLVVENLTNQN